MHTSEQAKTLWCPMARVAQAGSTDTSAAYNRTLTKQHVPLKLAVVQNPADFDLGDAPAPEQRTELFLQATTAVSMAAKCLGDQCACWRWEPTRPVGEASTGYCGLAGRPEVAL